MNFIVGLIFDVLIETLFHYVSARVLLWALAAVLLGLGFYGFALWCCP